jgi:transposase
MCAPTSAAIKPDRADAEAILEAVRSGKIPGVPVKRTEQQALVAILACAQWMTRWTAHSNALRVILREHGLLLPAGPRAALQAVPRLLDDAASPLPMHLRHGLTSVHEDVHAIEARIALLERELRAAVGTDPVVVRTQPIRRTAGYEFTA